jgi:hypothetical protein
MESSIGPLDNRLDTEMKPDPNEDCCCWPFNGGAPVDVDPESLGTIVHDKQSGRMKGESKDVPTGPIPLQDKISMAVLLVLYCLQGIPMGLSGSIPILLKERNVSFEGLALFSLVSLPFSLKLLWAPFVDSLYINLLGRRKTWLIPIQLLCGSLMIAGARHIGNWLGAENEV